VFETASGNDLAKSGLVRLHFGADRGSRRRPRCLRLRSSGEHAWCLPVWDRTRCS